MSLLMRGAYQSGLPVKGGRESERERGEIGEEDSE